MFLWMITCRLVHVTKLFFRRTGEKRKDKQCRLKELLMPLRGHFLASGITDLNYAVHTRSIRYRFGLQRQF